MKILVAYDGTLNAKDVLRYGVFRAKTLGGSLEVLHVMNSKAFSEYEGISAEDRALRESDMFFEEVKKILQEAGKGLKVSFISIEGDPQREIMKHINEEKIDLLLIPQHYASFAKHAPCRVSVVPRDFSTFKVLLVDDEVEFVTTLAKRLNLRNLRTEAVTNGAKALEFVKTYAPDIMVLDLRMPGMDGIDVLKQTKQINPAVQVIILSGRETEADRIEARKYGAFDMIHKPADIDMLGGKIKEAFWTKVEKPLQAFEGESQ